MKDEELSPEHASSRRSQDGEFSVPKLRPKDAPKIATAGGVDEARSYIAGAALPRPREHRTFEMETVKVNPLLDPRKAPTQARLQTTPEAGKPAFDPSVSTDEVLRRRGLLPPAAEVGSRGATAPSERFPEARPLGSTPGTLSESPRPGPARHLEEAAVAEPWVATDPGAEAGAARTVGGRTARLDVGAPADPPEQGSAALARKPPSAADDAVASARTLGGRTERALLSPPAPGVVPPLDGPGGMGSQVGVDAGVEPRSDPAAGSLADASRASQSPPSPPPSAESAPLVLPALADEAGLKPAPKSKTEPGLGGPVVGAPASPAEPAAGLEPLCPESKWVATAEPERVVAGALPSAFSPVTPTQRLDEPPLPQLPARSSARLVATLLLLAVALGAIVLFLLRPTPPTDGGPIGTGPLPPEGQTPGEASSSPDPPEPPPAARAAAGPGEAPAAAPGNPQAATARVARGATNPRAPVVPPPVSAAPPPEAPAAAAAPTSDLIYRKKGP